jgi:hypothetical protein
MYKLRFKIDDTEARLAGDYTVNKTFKVSRMNSKTRSTRSISRSRSRTKERTISKKSINGIVVQKVQKHTTARTQNGIILNSTDTIQEFTSNNVKFACSIYLEYFHIKDGDLFPITMADGFAGGAIAKYEFNRRKRKYEAIFDDEDPSYITSGEIIHIGESVFLTGDNETTVKALPWVTGAEAEEFASNGLPYLDTGHWDNIKRLANSNMITHKVVVRWENSGESEISSTMY